MEKLASRHAITELMSWITLMENIIQEDQSKILEAVGSELVQTYIQKYKVSERGAAEHQTFISFHFLLPFSLFSLTFLFLYLSIFLLFNVFFLIYFFFFYSIIPFCLVFYLLYLFVFVFLLVIFYLSLFFVIFVPFF